MSISSAWHTPEAKFEAILEAYLTAMSGTELEGLNIYTRFSGETIAEPALMITAETATPEPINALPPTGNWIIQGRLVIRSHYTESNVKKDATDHDLRIGWITDQLTRTDMVSLLNQVRGDLEFTCLWFFLTGRDNSVDGHSYITGLSCEALISPSILT